MSSLGEAEILRPGQPQLLFQPGSDKGKKSRPQRHHLSGERWNGNVRGNQVPLCSGTASHECYGQTVRLIYGQRQARFLLFGQVHEDGLKRKAMLGGTTFVNVFFNELRINQIRI